MKNSRLQRIFHQQISFGAQCLKTIKFRQISARAFHLSKYELHTMKLHPSYDMSKFRLGTSLLWVLDPGSRRRTLFSGEDYSREEGVTASFAYLEPKVQAKLGKPGSPEIKQKTC